MRIKIGGSEVFSRRYRSLDELMDEYVDHMNERGRRVPDYDVSVLLNAFALWLLSAVGQQLISEVAERIRRGKEEEEARKARELEETRHSELMAKMEEPGKGDSGSRGNSARRGVSPNRRCCRYVSSAAMGEEGEREDRHHLGNGSRG